MTVLRIAANIGTSAIAEVRIFYEMLLGMRVAMDHGWILTLTSGATAATQISIATEGGSGNAGAGSFDRGERCGCGVPTGEVSWPAHRLSADGRALGRAAVPSARSGGKAPEHPEPRPVMAVRSRKGRA